MKFWKRLIIGGGLATILITIWIFWHRAPTAKMASYIPAETLVYLEVNSLPQILNRMTKSSAWRELTPRYGVEQEVGNFSRLNQILADLNLGSTQSVVFGRAQIGVALMSVGAADAGESLNIRPQFAIVIETKSTRAGEFVESEITDFARRQFGEMQTEKKESDGAAWTIFRARTDERDLFAAVAGTIVVIGNDEAAVAACLDAKNGKRKSLADDENLEKMRVNTESETAFAFGYVTPAGVKQLSNVGAVMFAGQITEDARAMSLLAQSLPPFVQKSVTAIGWTARGTRENKIEDRYLVQMPPDLVSALRQPLHDNPDDNTALANLLPANLRSVTFYNLENSQAAWRGVILALTTKLDFVSAAAFSQTASGLLEPYGIEKADRFLGATNGTIVTLQPLSEEETTIVAVNVKDAGALKQTLQTNSEKESEFISDSVLLGTKPDLQMCRAAREQNQTLATQPIWLEFNNRQTPPRGTFVRTLKRDETTPINFVKLFAKNKGAELDLPGGEKLPDWIWTTSETRLLREGFERRVTSPFGLIGTLATSFADN